MKDSSNKVMPRISKSTYKMLEILRERAVGEYIYRANIKQDELAKLLGITRQALSIKMKPFIKEGYIRTGRGFIEITEKGMQLLGYTTKPVYIMVKVSPDKRPEVYEKVKKEVVGKVSRILGDYDLIIEVDSAKASDVLNLLSSLQGVEETKTYFTLEVLK